MEAGRLTDENLHSIKEQLQKVAGEEAGFKAKNGEMSGWQTLQLQVELQKLQLNFDRPYYMFGRKDTLSILAILFRLVSLTTTFTVPSSFPSRKSNVLPAPIVPS